MLLLSIFYAEMIFSCLTYDSFIGSTDIFHSSSYLFYIFVGYTIFMLEKLIGICIREKNSLIFQFILRFVALTL